MNHLEVGLSNKNQWYKPIAIFSAVFATYLLGSIIGLIIYVVITGDISNLISLDIPFIPLLFVGAFMPFLGLFPITILLIKVFYKRSFQMVINGTKAIRWSRVFFGMLVWGQLIIVQILLAYFIDPDNFIITFQWKSFIPILLVSIIIFSIQSSFEEFFFRGYLAQVFAGWFKSRWIAIIIPSILFGLIHSANPEVPAYGFFPMMIQYIGIGFIFALVSTFDDGIELAVGAHIINNILSASFVSFGASALENTSAIFYIKDMGAQTIFSALFSVFIPGAIFMFILTLKYKWKIFSNKIKSEEEIKVEELDERIEKTQEKITLSSGPKLPEVLQCQTEIVVEDEGIDIVQEGKNKKD